MFSSIRLIGGLSISFDGLKADLQNA